MSRKVRFSLATYKDQVVSDHQSSENSLLASRVLLVQKGRTVIKVVHRHTSPTPV